jgi:hypothetical protein
MMADDDSSLAARRARLRGSLARAIPDPYNPNATIQSAEPALPTVSEVHHGGEAVAGKNGELVAEETNSIGESAEIELDQAVSPEDGKSSYAVADPQSEVLSRQDKDDMANGDLASFILPGPDLLAPNLSTQVIAGGEVSSERATELLSNIEQSVSVCAINLSMLQKVFADQNETLTSFSEMLRKQTFPELGLNLSSLVESMAAALEPMKAVGELLPAIYHLVQSLQDRESSEAKDGRLTPEQLVTNLADQLCTGLIDPPTFRAAYTAVYPADHPADLLHRLADLLGTQRLSNELFRAAYDAVEGMKAPPGVHYGSELDPSLLTELSSLRQLKQDLELRDKQREEDEARRIRETQEQIDARWQEFNKRYEDLTEGLKIRDEQLRHTESELALRAQELSEKDSENQVLRAQMEELAEQLQETVKELHKQPIQAASRQDDPEPRQLKPTPGFFEPSTSHTQAAGLFENGPARPLFGQDETQNLPGQVQTREDLPAQANSGVPASSGAASGISVRASRATRATVVAKPVDDRQSETLPTAPVPGPSETSAGAPPSDVASQPQAIPRQPVPGPSTFVPGAGSYGTGVRAQVFEVIVRQALAGAPWRELCANPMQANNISVNEVEAEVKRRQALLKK